MLALEAVVPGLVRLKASKVLKGGHDGKGARAADDEWVVVEATLYDSGLGVARSAEETAGPM